MKRDREPVFARDADGVGCWWRTGACGPCGRESVLVTWTGTRRDVYGCGHTHTFSCSHCLAPGRRPAPAPAPAPAPVREPVPSPPPIPAGTWVHLAATALSCVSVICAAAAFLIATG
jgi:hypothetical protein